MITATELTSARIVPVVTDVAPELAATLGLTLHDAGLPVIELALRSEFALEALAALIDASTGLTVGAGTVLRPEQVDAVADLGVEFVVSPGLSPAVARRCLDRRVLFVPGVCTPTEILTALELDLNLLKFFPAQQAGGVAYLKALAGPFPQVSWVPTGGINADNASEYLSMQTVAAVGGSWFVRPDLIAAGDFDQISELAKAAIVIGLAKESVEV
ncbi:MAG: bifunctional 4-hydroxy-2-oxoglutarate aldolase/2-dehydro-3-deoxy-phosphogluconate aldolase [Solirubrobacteraceae bacterium]